MPQRAKRLCQCGHIVQGPCPHCRSQRERVRGSAYSRGFGQRQAAWSKVILGNDPICRGCGREWSRFADHVICVPSDNRDAGDWSEANGQGLCPSCDGYKRRVEQYDKTFGPRLREAGVPRGWRHLKAFGGDS